MFTRPGDLADSNIVEALTEGWGLDVQAVEHAPVGFGSHHWIASSGVRRWFVTVDELEASRRDDAESLAEITARHTAALQLAWALKDLGLDFVIAPVLTLAGVVIHPLKGSYVASLYPYVDGKGFTWGRFESREQLMAVLDRVATVHEASPQVAGIGTVDDLVIPMRGALVEACSDRDQPWGPGPFADEAKSEERSSNADEDVLSEQYPDRHEEDAGAITEAERPGSSNLTGRNTTEPDSRLAPDEPSSVDSNSHMASAAPPLGASPADRSVEPPTHSFCYVDHVVAASDDRLMTNDLAQADTTGYTLAFVPSCPDVDYR